MSSNSTKNDIAWMKLFDKYNIMNRLKAEGFYIIKANQINEFREARLMTKFDHKINLPQIFKANQLSILPITRGDYIISYFDSYKIFEDRNQQIKGAAFPEYLESIDVENINSEAIAINCAFASGILQDFFEDINLLPTICGRMSSNTFDFNIWNTSTGGFFKINVQNSQIEIDNGYEGLRSLFIIEAKNFISDDFLIRQLYYPYRLWHKLISKKITPIFLIYSNGIYNLYQYEFSEQNNYNSIELVKQQKYCIEPIDISLNDIVDISKSIRYTEEPNIPFPQADSFNRIINLCELLLDNEMTKEEITLNYAFDQRQTNYYTDAGRYLGLIGKRNENEEIVYFLTKEGQETMKLPIKSRQLSFIRTVLSHKVFNETLNLYFKNVQVPTINDVVKIMKEVNVYNIEAASTFERRASTVLGWINWILDLQS